MDVMSPRSSSATRWLKSSSLTVVVVLLWALVGAAMPPVQAAAGDKGYAGPSFAGSGSNEKGPTGEKPESKLWWNDGHWWASMWDAQTSDFYIFRLNLATQTWVKTTTVLDNRANSRADTLWDGNKLYVASHVFTESPGSSSSNNGRLWRFSYAPSTDTYTLDSGFPVNINSVKTETLVIDKDSTGKLWATWVQPATINGTVYRKVYVSYTNGSDATWATPVELPISKDRNKTESQQTTSVGSDDISSVLAFGGNKIGVMWSNQNTKKMFFAVHEDGAPTTTWQAEETALPGSGCFEPDPCADDHINLASLQEDGSGRVYAAVKTSHSNSNQPLIMLLVRNQPGNWSGYRFGVVADNHTRPIVLLDTRNMRIHMFATRDENNGSIYEKSTPIASPSFATGAGDTFIEKGTALGTSGPFNNPTSTKQNLTCAMGLVVLASDNVDDRYWHNYRPLPGCDGAPSDTTNPTVSLTAPTNGATVAGNVTVSANASDEVGVVGVQFKLDGANLGSEVTSAPYNYTWNTATATNGSHTLTAVARDAAGNTSTSTVVNVTVSNASSDATPPTVAVTAPADGATVAGSVAVSAEAHDNVGVAGVQFKLNGTNLGSEDTTSPYSIMWDTTTVANGNHTLTAVARDAAGNATPSAPVTVTVSNTSTGGGTLPAFSAEADTFVDQANPTLSYGTNTQLQVVGNSTSAKQSFIRFTVSGVPAGASVGTAKLRLVVTNDSTSGGIFSAITSNTWAESVTWNTKPAIDGPQLASLGAVPLNQVVEVDVTSVVSGNGTYSFAITHPSGNTNTLGYASRQNGTATNRPQLIVTTK